MVSEPDKDFLSTILSTDRYFDIKGCKTPKDIERRARHAIRLMNKELETTRSETVYRNLLKGIKLLGIMMDNHSPVTEKTARIKRKMGVPEKRCGMQYRIIDEAKKDPKGYFANCLRWGIDVAKLIEENERIREIFS